MHATTTRTRTSAYVYAPYNYGVFAACAYGNDPASCGRSARPSLGNPVALGVAIRGCAKMVRRPERGGVGGCEHRKHDKS